ncbi:MAG: hypothetical protein IJF54_03405 [Clostridia bacterium]|nr:hypothetical protein [Clostridia bacterium]
MKKKTKIILSIVAVTLVVATFFAVLLVDRMSYRYAATKHIFEEQNCAWKAKEIDLVLFSNQSDYYKSVYNIEELEPFTPFEVVGILTVDEIKYDVRIFFSVSKSAEVLIKHGNNEESVFTWFDYSLFKTKLTMEITKDESDIFPDEIQKLTFKRVKE